MKLKLTADAGFLLKSMKRKGRKNEVSREMAEKW